MQNAAYREETRQAEERLRGLLKQHRQLYIKLSQMEKVKRPSPRKETDVSPSSSPSFSDDSSRGLADEMEQVKAENEKMKRTIEALKEKFSPLPQNARNDAHSEDR